MVDVTPGTGGGGRDGRTPSAFPGDRTRPSNIGAPGRDGRDGGGSGPGRPGWNDGRGSGVRTGAPRTSVGDSFDHGGGHGDHDADRHDGWRDDHWGWYKHHRPSFHLNINFNYFDHGHCYYHPYYDYGFWISYRGTPWYYCPTYRPYSYVYVSRVYVDHYYFGAGQGQTADRVVEYVDRGWKDIEHGWFTSARRNFAKAADLSPDWGLPKIGYALAVSGMGYDRVAAPMLLRAFAEDPYAALEIPWSEELDLLLEDMDRRNTDLAYRGVSPADTWFTAAAARLLLGDIEGASEAAFEAETAGASYEAIDGMLEVLSGYEREAE